MGNYTLTDAKGKEYDVEAPSIEEATKGFKDWQQKQINDQYTKNAEEAPAWAKPLMAVQDAALSGIDTLSAGTVPWAVDKLTGTEDATQATAASKNRMGWAGTALDVGMLSRFLPSLAPKAIQYMKGGPAAKTIVGATTAAGEGAGVGAVTAATHDDDVPTGAGLGAAGGAIGQAIGSGINRVAKAFAPSDIPAATKITVLPAKPTRTQIVESTVNNARSAASKSDSALAEQKALKDAFEALNTGPQGKALTPGQRALVEKIYQGDPATNASRVAGNFLGNKFLAPAASAGVAAAAGGFIPGLLTAGGLAAGSRALKGISAGGTEDAVQNLRRTMAKHPKFVGPISVEERAKLANMVRQGLLTGYPED